MSSIVNVAVTSAPADRPPAARDAHGELVRDGGAVWRHVELEADSRARSRSASPGRGRCARWPRRSPASAFGGGGRLESTAATATAAATSSTSPLTSLRRSIAALMGRARRRSARARCGAGCPTATSIAQSSSAALTMIAWPYDVCHSDASVGRCSTDAPTPEPKSTITEPNATFEKRGTHDDEAGQPSRRGEAAPQHEQADEAADPERAGEQMQPVECERERTRRRLRGVAGRARDEQHGAGGECGAAEGEQLCDRAPVAVGTIDPQRNPRRDGEEREQQLEVEVATPERRRRAATARAPRTTRTSAGRTPRSPAARRPGPRRARCRAQTQNATQSSARGGRATSGRAIAMRSTNSPIAAISERNTSQRAATSVGVAAVSDSDGITNCGAGPGFGPTANVNAPRTGWPSTEITRQTTRYQPSPQALERDVELVGVRRRAVRWPGRLLVRGRVGDRDDREARLDRLASRRAPPGAAACSTVTLAAGVVFSSAACAQRRRRRGRAPPRRRAATTSDAPHRTCKRERRRQHVAVDLTLEKQPPRSGHGHEHADRRACRASPRCPSPSRAPNVLVQPLAPGAHTCVWK